MFSSSSFTSSTLEGHLSPPVNIKHQVLKEVVANTKPICT